MIIHNGNHSISDTFIGQKRKAVNLAQPIMSPTQFTFCLQGGHTLTLEGNKTLYWPLLGIDGMVTKLQLFHNWYKLMVHVITWNNRLNIRLIPGVYFQSSVGHKGLGLL